MSQNFNVELANIRSDLRQLRATINTLHSPKNYEQRYRLIQEKLDLLSEQYGLLDKEVFSLSTSLDSLKNIGHDIGQAAKQVQDGLPKLQEKLKAVSVLVIERKQRSDRDREFVSELRRNLDKVDKDACDELAIALAELLLSWIDHVPRSAVSGANAIGSDENPKKKTGST